MTGTRDKTKQRLQEQLKSVLSQNDENSVAAALFGITSSEYLKFNYDMVADKDVFERMNHTMNDYQDVLKDLLKEKFDDNYPDQSLQFAIQLMDNLIRLGDMHSAYAIKAGLADIEFRNRNNPDFATAIKRLSPEMAVKLNQIKVDRSMFLLENYEKFKGVSVPYFGIYANTADKLKEAARSSSQQSEAGKKKQGEVLEKTLKFLNATKLFARKNRDSTETTLIGNLKTYIDGYALSSSNADKKKFNLGKVLFSILNQYDLTPDEKTRALKNFIDQAPKVLEHKNPRNKGREHTLEKMAKDLLVFYSQEQDLKKSQRVTNLAQAKKLFTEQLATTSKKTPAPPSRAGRRSLSEPVPVKSGWENTKTPNRPRRHSQSFLFSKDRQAQQGNAPQKTADQLKVSQSSSEKMQKNAKVSKLVQQFEGGIFSHGTANKSKTVTEQKKANPESPHHRSRRPTK